MVGEINSSLKRGYYLPLRTRASHTTFNTMRVIFSKKCKQQIVLTLTMEKSTLSSVSTYATAHFSTDPVVLVRTFYMVAAGAITITNAIPSFQKRFVHYGARRTDTKDEDGRPVVYEEPSSGPYTRILDLAASFKVPHSWFIHFYVISVASSLFWAQQIMMRGFTFNFLARLYEASSYHHPSMNTVQVLIVVFLMGVQGSRRLYECITLNKPSTSKMAGPAWILGIMFYLVMGVSVWVEGIRRHNQPLRLTSADKTTASLLGDRSISQAFQENEALAKAFFGLPLFIFASVAQHQCHVHLASLKKYSLPTYKWFQLIISPHYTFECLIYLALAHIAAPKSQLFNKSIMTALFFEVFNLGVTAESTRAWYSQKFGPESVKGKWRMFPYVY